MRATDIFIRVLFLKVELDKRIITPEQFETRMDELMLQWNRLNNSK